MPASLDLDIREHLARYLAGDDPIDAFRGWFGPATWEVERGGNALATQLAMEIELWLAEMDHGHRSEDDVKHHFAQLITRESAKPARQKRVPAASS
jgi:hypothetical protein